MFRPKPLVQADERVERHTILQLRDGELRRVADALAVERALQIFAVAAGSGEERLVASTMRTPGSDVELAIGFFYAEGILQTREDLTDWRLAGDRIFLHLESGAFARAGAAWRLTLTSSACGVCGREDPNALLVPAISERAALFQIQAEVVGELPRILTTQQAGFQATGGLHAAGLFSPMGELWNVAEDVGRHNAVDKLVGERFLAADGHASVGALVVSGRASFELVQKAARADFPMLIAVGAPSTLAVESALRANMTLVGFTRQRAFNVYAGAHRIITQQVAS